MDRSTLLVCLAFAVVLVAADGQQDCTNAMRLQCIYSNLALCGATQFPAPQANNNYCCPNLLNCRLPQACNETVVRACRLDSLPLCAAGAAQTRASALDCCPTCRLPPRTQDGCNVDPSTIPRCADGVVPTITSSGCPSCRPPEGRVGNCNATSLAACATSFPSLPDCSADQLLERANQEDGLPGSVSNIFSPASCCLTCKPNYNKYCNQTTIQACRANHDNLPVCTSGQAAFVAGSCCRQCRRNPATWIEKPDASGVCSAENLRQCFRKIPVCRNGERPFVDAARFCCPECRRPERTCSLEDVVRCRTQQPACAAGELPSFVQGECCATCAPVKASCTCDTTTQVCVYGRDVTQTPTCARKLTVTFTLTPAANNAERLARATAVQIGHLVREIVSRFCEQNANDNRCQKRATQIRNSEISGVANADGSYTITVTYPEVADDPVSSGGSQSLAANILLAVDANAALYTDAAANAEAGAGYTVTSSPSAAFVGARASAVFVALSALVAVVVGRFF